MASELQRVAQDLLACLELMPRVVAALYARAQRCREAAGYVGGLSSRSPVLQAAAYQLDAAARECEQAAHFCDLAWQRARDWASQMVGGDGAAASPRQATD